MKKSIKSVKEFWNKNPLYTGEGKYDVHTKDFFIEHELVCINDCMAGDPSKLNLAKYKNKKILDAGCGIGFWTRQYSKHNLNVTALDLSVESLKINKISLNLFNLNASLINGNIEELPFKSCSFDHIVCDGVIHHSPDTEKCIEELHRVLKKEGSLILSLYHRNILLKSKLVFNCLRSIGKLLNAGLRGRGRENIFSKVSTADEFVRAYDGMDNPVGKSYTYNEIKKMIGDKFSINETYKYLFPIRNFKIKIPKYLHRLLQKQLGLLIVFELKKNCN